MLSTVLSYPCKPNVCTNVFYLWYVCGVPYKYEKASELIFQKFLGFCISRVKPSISKYCLSSYITVAYTGKALSINDKLLLLSGTFHMRVTWLNSS